MTREKAHKIAVAISNNANDFWNENISWNEFDRRAKKLWNPINGNYKDACLIQSCLDGLKKEGK